MGGRQRRASGGTWTEKRYGGREKEGDGMGHSCDTMLLRFAITIAWPKYDLEILREQNKDVRAWHAWARVGKEEPADQII